MRFASLGSGSRGNATLVQNEKTTVMIDCGFSTREVVKRLQRFDLSPDDLDAILVTHEHSDHIGGVGNLAKKYALPIYATPGTASFLPEAATEWVNTFNCHEKLTIKDIEITPFPVPHDAREPSQFKLSDGDMSLGVLTDLGSLTPLIVETLTGCQALMLETNHDTEMLANGIYPEHLKRRVGGRLGHLNNVQSASLLNQIDTSQLQHILAMHISEKNNKPELVTPLLAEALSCEESWIGIADQNLGFDWRELTSR
jgi:phosphoribosyl 1,2-cyclic phosphodiesterase